MTPFGGHLPPPFYRANDEAGRRRGHLQEERIAHPVREDTANYGRGGYYGVTYRPAPYPQNDYRSQGDRRWTEAEHPWGRERHERTGYRSLNERVEASGNHRGKGPRSYRRPDSRIREDISDRLYDDPFVNAVDVEITVHDGTVILTGTVEDRPAKRRVEDISESVSGVQQIENRLRITAQQGEK